MKKNKVRTNHGPKIEKKPRDLQQLDDRELQELISRRAYELYQERGCEDGHDCEDWLKAESELLAEMDGLGMASLRTLLPIATPYVEARTKTS